MALLTPSNLRTVRLDLSGVEQYLERIQTAGGNVEEVVKTAIKESAKLIEEDISKWAEKHKLTGAVLGGVNVSDIKIDGGKISVDVGIDTTISENSWHAVFVEYGTPRNSPDPGIRNAFDNNKNKVKRLQKQILAEGGIPV